ncbi:DUF803-domain-containing protein [Hymenopellis radicata]|nr:DUF803-domain-containing protein [Hymenopellis radicata]
MPKLPPLDPYDLSGKLPELDTATVVGITVAVAGNVIISLALNLQKLAHKRLDAEKLKANGDGKRVSTGPSLNERDEENLVDSSGDESEHTIRGLSRASESEPLLPLGRPRVYGAPEPSSKSTFVTFLASPFRKKTPASIIPVDVVMQSPPQSKTPAETVDEGNESDYLKSKLWWIGFLLMNVGELGNFISYAWAPASVVAPLGTFALIANCFFAPLIIQERFRTRDLLGILFAVVGAVTVVLASNTSDTRLDPDRLLKAISQTPFIVYSLIYVVGAICLSILSEGPLGRRNVFIDVGLCALFGGFTVLSTKAISTLLTMQWIDMFTHPITYPVILVLALTGVGQIKYLNRALMRFDSKIVIPTQFVLFNLSAIVGSAIMYGDFQKASFHQIVTFLYGCAATFAGVFIISSASGVASTSDIAEEDHTPNSSDGEGDGGPSPRPRRATLILPQPPDLRHRQSTVSLMGLSNAHHLLLVHTPSTSRESPLFDWERGTRGTPTASPETLHRNRAMSWFGDSSREVLPRESSVSRRPESVHQGPRSRVTVDGTTVHPNSAR